MPTAPTPIRNITRPVPLSTDPENFDLRADQAWSELPDAIDDIDAAGDVTYLNAQEVFDKAAEIEDTAADVQAAAMVAANAAGLLGRSNVPLTVGAGAKAITLLVAKPDLVELNRRVAIINRADPSIRMFGTISSVTSTTQFTVTVVSSGAFGSGSYSSWHIMDAAFFGSAATKETIREGTDDTAAITSKSLAEVAQPVAVAYASIVTLNMKAGINFVIDTLTGNIQLANPTGMADKIGQSGSISIKTGAGGFTNSFGTYWKPALVHQSISAAANKNDTFYYEIKAADRIEYNILRGFLA